MMSITTNRVVIALIVVVFVAMIIQASELGFFGTSFEGFFGTGQAPFGSLTQGGATPTVRR